MKKYKSKRKFKQIIIDKIKRVIFSDDYDKKPISGKNPANFRQVSDRLKMPEMPYISGLEGSLFFADSMEKKPGTYSQGKVVNFSSKIGKNNFDLSSITKISDKIDIFKNYMKMNSENKTLNKTLSAFQNDLNITKSQVETLIKRSLELNLIEKISQSTYKIKFKN